jgi:hypothetical protein
MTEKIYLKNVLPNGTRPPEESLEVFALLNLGILKALEHGLMSASEALRLFFHAENSLFVRQQLANSIADEIMSRGIQLPDLFDVLPVDEAQREFQRELVKLYTLCLNLLEQKMVAA